VDAGTKSQHLPLPLLLRVDGGCHRRA